MRFIVAVVTCVLVACGPETPEPIPGSNNDRTGPSSVLDFPPEPRLDTSFGVATPEHWEPVGCQWGHGIAPRAETPDMGSPHGFSIDRAGCSTESHLVDVPSWASGFTARVRTDLRGHACSLGDCNALVVRWFNANRRMLSVSEYDVGPFGIEIPYEFNHSGDIPTGARYVSLAFYVPRDLREEAATLFTRLSFDFQ